LHCPVTVKASSNIPTSQAVDAASSQPAEQTSAESDAMEDGGDSQVVTKELCSVINEEIEKLRKSKEEIVASLQSQVAHLKGEKPDSDENAMIEEIGSIGTVCEQLQQQNTSLTQQLTNQYDQYSRLSRDKLAMEMRLKEVERDLNQSRLDRDEACRRLQELIQMNVQNADQVTSLTRLLNDEKQGTLSLSTRISQANIGRETAESKVSSLKSELREVQSQLESKTAELTRAQSEKENYEQEVEREVAGLTRVYKSKLKYALGLLSASGNSATPAAGKSRLKKTSSSSALTIRPEFKDLLPDEEIENFEVSGKGAVTEDTMVDDDLGSLYRQRVLCSVCAVRDRERVLKRCGHTFCETCINKCLHSRNRKCPKCHASFGDADIIRFIL